MQEKLTVNGSHQRSHKKFVALGVASHMRNPTTFRLVCVLETVRRMADILDQPDNELDLYGDGELDAHFSERDVLGDDDEDVAK